MLTEYRATCTSSRYIYRFWLSQEWTYEQAQMVVQKGLDALKAPTPAQLRKLIRNNQEINCVEVTSHDGFGLCVHKEWP